MTRLPLLALAATLACGSAAPPPETIPYEERYPAMQRSAMDEAPGALPVAPPIRQRAWAKAKRAMARAGLGPVPPHIRPPKSVRVREVFDLESEDGHPGRLFGLYQMTRFLDPEDGTMRVAEQVLLFLPEDCLVELVLTHEYVHALHARLGFLNSSWNLIAPEDFIAQVLGPEYIEWPACEEND